ncbi:NADPH-dependent F420 reductase [Quadrisphaera oryzae]|uniref:NADPH-dependent F420 reductase n=1 Tax=Quadrisphaera TaxID=317661 RepID=UPI0016447FD4|nr:NAD(P)-binding domain-containing protein [Quadrisphaera sp. RL12-1S]MBC3760855.1 NAD(P)-binding domain-containing protein [Quadrisphaera sp. RL12-1S]
MSTTETPGSSSLTVGIIGAGNIGSTLAKLAVDAGHRVVIANSRGPETLADLVAQLGEGARAATAAEAAQAGDLVVVTVPLKNYRELPAEQLAGKVVLDTNNYYPDRDGRIAELDDHSATTSELVARHLAGASVVKVFNNIFFVALAALSAPAGDPARAALPIFGDDDDAKATATRFLDSIGYDAVDGGPLARSWRSENGRPVYVMPYATNGDVSTPAPADAATVRSLLEAAELHDPAQQPKPLS